MKKVVIVFIIWLSCNYTVKAELEFENSKYFSILAETIKISKNGILLGEYSNNINSSPFNGLFLDDSANLDFSAKVLGGYKITDIDEDSNSYFATSYMTINGKQGLFKISKDFKQIENIGVKAATKKVLQYKEKVYTGGYTHGCYVVNKDGSNLVQILGDGYFGPQIDDIKANSKNVYVLSRGLLYKVDYQSNQKEQLLISQRPSYIDVDEERIYLAAYNKFYYLGFDNKLSNEKTFYNKITYLKKYNNLIILVETDSLNNYFWISNDKGLNFYKSKATLPASKTIKDIEVTGDKIYTLYLNVANQGVLKGKLLFDYTNSNIFNSPFNISKDSDIKDKITSFFDHRYPYLGNNNEPDEYKNTTLNFRAKELEEPYLYYSSHDGIDWGLPLNTPIYSVYEGEASYFFDNYGLGHTIKISHPNNFLTIYGHLSEEDLITKDKPTRVAAGQKIGKVGMSGNTNGPHLHFTTYKGDKTLKNKVDPFGWDSSIADPWETFGSKSSYLWNLKNNIQSIQANPTKNYVTTIDKLSIELLNLNSIFVPINIEVEAVPPIYDLKNFKYKSNTSYQLTSFDLESKTIPQSILGILSFSGFKSGDDKYYSIWKVTDNSVEKQVTTFNSYNQTLSTIFEPKAQYLVLRDNYKKISVKSNLKAN
jgi:murein DD-endopeptidase MepM/ murein hydrolase activator NlpD